MQVEEKKALHSKVRRKKCKWTGRWAALAKLGGRAGGRGQGHSHIPASGPRQHAAYVSSLTSPGPPQGGTEKGACAPGLQSKDLNPGTRKLVLETMLGGVSPPLPHCFVSVGEAVRAPGRADSGVLHGSACWEWGQHTRGPASLSLRLRHDGRLGPGPPAAELNGGKPVPPSRIREHSGWPVTPWLPWASWLGVGSQV